MRFLLATLMLFGLVGCAKEHVVEEVAEVSRKRYQSTGLEGVYLVDATAEVKSAFDTYLVEYVLIAELLSDQPLLFSLTTGDKEPQFAGPPRTPGKATYQCFIRLTKSDSESVRKWEITIKACASDQITLDNALEMEPNERLPRLWSLSKSTTQPIAGGGARVELPSSTPKLRENGIVSIYSTGLAEPDPKNVFTLRVVGDRFSLDIRTAPKEQSEREVDPDR